VICKRSGEFVAYRKNFILRLARARKLPKPLKALVASEGLALFFYGNKNDFITVLNGRRKTYASTEPADRGNGR
jgi:hypothetical protein